jgi:uncharacterized membrane protein YeaQ/YmgE (transglycosylase-associated protein family)
MIGFITGAVTRFFYKKMPIGEISTAMIFGLLGSVVSGWAGSKIGLYEYGDNKGLIASAAGSIILVFIYSYFRQKKRVSKV